MSAINVRAIKDGYYGDIYRREGEVFEIADSDAFSDSWMVAVDGKGEALAKQPGKGKKTAKQVKEEASAARSTIEGEKANKQSAMAATLGTLEPEMDTEEASKQETAK